jgi:hypothetical protein
MENSKVFYVIFPVKGSINTNRVHKVRNTEVGVSVLSDKRSSVFMWRHLDALAGLDGTTTKRQTCSSPFISCHDGAALWMCSSPFPTRLGMVMVMTVLLTCLLILLPGAYSAADTVLGASLLFSWSPWIEPNSPLLSTCSRWGNRGDHSLRILPIKVCPKTKVLLFSSYCMTFHYRAMAVWPVEEAEMFVG